MCEKILKIKIRKTLLNANNIKMHVNSCKLLIEMPHKRERHIYGAFLRAL